MLGAGLGSACASDDPGPMDSAGPITVEFVLSDTAVMGTPTVLPDGATMPVLAEFFGQASTTWLSPGEVTGQQYFLADEAIAIWMFFEYTSSEGVTGTEFLPFSYYPP